MTSIPTCQPCGFRLCFERCVDVIRPLQIDPRKIDRLLDLLELTEGDQVLEVGCGWGSLAIRNLGHSNAILEFDMNHR